MAKNQLPSVDVVKPIPGPKPDLATLQFAKEIGDQIIGEEMGYIPRRVDVKLNRNHGLILRDKLRRLSDDGAKTADGKFVTNKMQAVRWILENEVK